MLDLGAQYAVIRQEVRAALDGVLEAGQFILGPNVKALEQEVAAYCGTKFGIGLASGTDALILSLRAAGVMPGDEVIVPAFSYIATADTVSLLGAIPVFADVSENTFNLAAGQIERRITPRTKAIIAVHLFGQPADMDPILEIARRRSLAVIEDNAQAIGAAYKGRRAGSMGELGCLSFFPTKNLGAYGDAGMVVTDSLEKAARLRSLRGHGTTKNKYVSEEQGWNSRLDEVQAAILRVKLRHLNSWKTSRQANAARYSALLAGVPGITTPQTLPGAEHVYHQYTIRVSGSTTRDRVQKSLADQGIASMIYYPLPLHLQPMFAALGNKAGSLPVSERVANEVLSLPIYPELTAEQIERVAASVAAAARG
ncbi:MAG: DegT/DnrJ/EryC1/StrS family aminotransferase [Acidipila sp.]|nr:DegT/DnrJ/EryC1/StrS family aminotransferase [Acidipila sp.]